MGVRVTCPHCRQICTIGENLQGKAVSCPKCKKAFTGPSAPATPSGASCRLDIGSCTNKGKVRQRNEDCFLVQHLTWSDLDNAHETCMALVTDGLGGHAGGDQAARLVIRTVGSSMAGVLAGALSGQLRDTSLNALAKHIDSAIGAANQAVYAKAQAEPSLRGMGATIAAVLIWDGEILIGHVGDTRVYHHRDGDFKQITKDQTLVARMVELGQLTEEEAKDHPSGHEITQAIGLRTYIEPAAYRLKLEEGDSLIVACDGLHAHVDNRMISDKIRKTGYSASLLANELVDMANQDGGTDNITVVAINGY